MEYVLPIKSFEKNTYVSPYSTLLTSSEKTDLSYTLAILLYEVSIVYIFMSVLKLHITNAGELEVKSILEKIESSMDTDSTRMFKSTDLVFHFEFVDFFSLIYIIIFLLAFHAVYTTRFRPVVCGMIYPHIEESRAMALYHTILIQRQDLFDICYSLLLDRLANEGKEKPMFRFKWWIWSTKLYSRACNSFRRNVLSIIYEGCDLCGDYGKNHQINCET